MSIDKARNVDILLLCVLSSERKLSSQRRVMSIIIPRCGFNCNTKREVLYGPIELGGAIRHLYVEQGVGQIEFVGGQIAEDCVRVVSSSSGNIVFVYGKSSHTLLTTSRIEVACVVTRIPCTHRVPLTTG